MNKQLLFKNRLALRLPPGCPAEQLPITSPADGWRTSKGPILRKAVDNFYFAAKAHSLLFQKELDQAQKSKLPGVSNWLTLTDVENKTGALVPLRAGLLTAWYAEVGTLVLAYACKADATAISKPISTPFYLPDSWDTTGAEPFVSTLNKFHGSCAEAEHQLRTFSQNEHPTRILVSGYGDGAALAALAAPWLALSYPTADTELVTFNAAAVRSPEFMRLTEWAVGTRLPVVISGNEPAEQVTPEGISVPRLRLPFPGNSKNVSNIKSDSLAGYALSLKNALDIAPEIQTSGSGFAAKQYAAGSFWQNPVYGAALQDGVRAIDEENGNGDKAEQAAINWAASLALRGSGSNATHPPVKAAKTNELGYVWEPFDLVPGPQAEYTQEDHLRFLCAAMLHIPCIMSKDAYSQEETIRKNLLDYKLDEVRSEHVSDPSSGADAYVVWNESQGTLFLVFRGTETSQYQDILTDLDVLQLRGEVFETSKNQHPAWETVDPEANAREIGARVHRGFLTQFEALVGLPIFTLHDLWLPVSGTIRLLRWTWTRVRGKASQPRNIAEVVEEFTQGRAPLRIVCSGHSLGGALATIAALWASYSWPEASISCYTFGSPLVGCTDFVEVWRQAVGCRIRAVNGNDVVPSIPPGFFNYAHVKPGVWLRPGEQNALQLEYGKFKRPVVDLEASSWRRRFGRNVSDHDIKEGYLATIELGMKQLRKYFPGVKSAATKVAVGAKQ